MKPMEQIREGFCSIFKDYTNGRIARLIECSEPTVHRFRNGNGDSYKIAKHMADNFKGEYDKLYAECLDSRHKVRSCCMKKHRRTYVAKKPMYRVPPEYKKLPVAEIRSLIANTLPVIHSQPECHW